MSALPHDLNRPDSPGGPGDARRRPALVVDRIACMGRGVCAALAPDAIELDEWGYPIVRSQPSAQEAQAVVRHCPVRAPLLIIAQ